MTTCRNHQPPSRRRFMIAPEQVQGTEVLLSPSETRHLKRVLRLPRGEIVEICDGQGHTYMARITAREDTGARLVIVGEVSREAESPLAVCLGLALTRADVFDLVIRQMTEMGVHRLIPFVSTRSLIKPGGWSASRLQRWQRLAQDALKSSERNLLPQIEAPVNFPDILTGPEDLKIMCWEEIRAQEKTSPGPLSPPPASVRLLIGPEGGFSAAEADAARQAGFHLWTLGPRRLRVETAALAAVTLVQFLWGDLCRQ